MKETSLDQALAYENGVIPRRFMDEWNVDLEEASALFDDVKRWLFLCTRPGLDPVIHGPLVILDEAWHNFVLFTTQYTAYCRDLYGEYIHHAPTTHLERESVQADLAANFEATRDSIVARNAHQREAVLEHLGVDTLLRWYVDYPVRYGDEFFATARKRIKLNWQPDAALIALAAEVRASDD